MAKTVADQFAEVLATAGVKRIYGETKHAADSWIFVVDEDDSFRAALQRLLTSAGFTLDSFPNAELLLIVKRTDEPSCLSAIRPVIGREGVEHVQRQELAELRRHYSRLTARERQVMARIVVGRVNRQIAAEFGTSESTVKQQRAQVMKKMQATSLAQLVRLAARMESHTNPTHGQAADCDSIASAAGLNLCIENSAFRPIYIRSCAKNQEAGYASRRNDQII